MNGALLSMPDTVTHAEASMSLAEASVIIVSFNTRDLLRRCLNSLLEESVGISTEIIVVDNASRDGSADMVAEEFPFVRLVRSEVNLGFGNANNLGLREATGRYFVLLNSDAFLAPGALRLAIEHMDATPSCGLGGGRLIGTDGSWQPSARSFHSVLADALVYTGLAHKYPESRFFGQLDRTWADQMQPSQVDWVPGAFSIIRPDVMRQIGGFDPAFFLYYEEVDLCKRVHQAGYSVWYWPDVVITHIGGESSRQLKNLEFSSTSAQVVLWRMRSTMLYYRKHLGSQVHLARWMEKLLYSASARRNRKEGTPEREARAKHFDTMNRLVDQAWTDTNGGRVSPPLPW